MSASLLDSESAFAEKMEQRGLTELMEKFKEKGWTTFSTYAMSCDYVPGATGSESFKTEVVEKVLTAAQAPLIPRLKLLFTQSHVLLNNELAQQATMTADAPPRAIPEAEREPRRIKFMAEHTGIEVVGDLDPSFHLQDLTNAMAEKNTITHIQWKDCSSRDEELKGMKTIRATIPDHKGYLHETSYSEHRRSSADTDLKLERLLTRRGIALEEYDLMSYEHHKELVEVGIQAYTRKPLPGYKRITINHVYRYDQAYWTAMARKCRNNARRGSDGTRPIDKNHKAILDSTDVRLCLAPLQGSDKEKNVGYNLLHGLDDSDSSAESEDRKKKNKRKRDRSPPAAAGSSGDSQLVRDLRNQVKNLQRKGGKGNKGDKGKGKGKYGKDGKTGKNSARLPSALHGLSGKVDGGSHKWGAGLLRLQHGHLQQGAPR